MTTATSISGGSCPSTPATTGSTDHPATQCSQTGGLHASLGLFEVTVDGQTRYMTKEEQGTVSSGQHSHDTTVGFDHVSEANWNGAWKDAKDSALAGAGAMYGAAKVIAGGVFGVGQATYYSTSKVLYDATGSDVWKAQAATYDRGMEAIAKTLDGGVGNAFKGFVNSRVDRFMAAADAGDPFATGQAAGEPAMELALVAYCRRVALSLRPPRIGARRHWPWQWREATRRTMRRPTSSHPRAKVNH